MVTVRGPGILPGISLEASRTRSSAVKSSEPCDIYCVHSSKCALLPTHPTQTPLLLSRRSNSLAVTQGGVSCVQALMCEAVCLANPSALIPHQWGGDRLAFTGELLLSESKHDNATCEAGIGCAWHDSMLSKLAYSYFELQVDGQCFP